jgi:chromosome partitioning protein
MPVIGLLNQKGGVGKTTLAIHIATALSAHERVLLVDADPQISALDWSAQRTAPSLFTVIGFPRPHLHREIAALSRGYDWTVIDGAPRVGDLARSAIAASDIVAVPVQPSPFDVWGAKDILDIIHECQVHKPELKTCFVINRLFPNTTLGAEVNEALASFDVPVLRAAVRNRTDYAKAARTGLTAMETDPNGPAAEEIAALVAELTGLLKHADQQEKNHAAR